MTTSNVQVNITIQNMSTFYTVQYSCGGDHLTTIGHGTDQKSALLSACIQSMYEKDCDPSLEILQKLVHELMIVFEFNDDDYFNADDMSAYTTRVIHAYFHSTNDMGKLALFTGKVLWVCNEGIYYSLCSHRGYTVSCQQIVVADMAKMTLDELCKSSSSNVDENNAIYFNMPKF